MANNKEALALVLDVGPTMQLGKESTCFENALYAMNMIIQRKLFSESKDEIVLVLFGTKETKNSLADSNPKFYQHISVTRQLAPVNFEFLEYFQQISNDCKFTTSADFVDALVVAMDELQTSTEGKKGFGSKRIILLSNFNENFNPSNMEDIIGALFEAQIEINFIIPALDEDAIGEDINDKENKANGEALLTNEKISKNQSSANQLVNSMLEQAKGEIFSFEEILPFLSFIQSRQIKSNAWKCSLKIGASLDIPVCFYTKMKEMKAKSFKNVCGKNYNLEIERSRMYHLKDENETEINKEDLVDGHRYGSTLVPFSSDDKEAIKSKNEKCLKVLGFTKTENVKRHHFMGDSTMICIAQKGNKGATVALSALINALYETNAVAIVRRVHANNGNVKLGCLVPQIKNKYECLYYNELPFLEDLREVTFGSLPVTESYTTAVNKKYAPTDEQLVIMEELIDKLDLSNNSKDEKEEICDEEFFKLKLLFNPYIQFLYQVLLHRALKPDEPIPDISPLILNSLEPPICVSEHLEALDKKLKQTFKTTLNEENKKAMEASRAPVVTNIFAAKSNAEANKSVLDDKKETVGNLISETVKEEPSSLANVSDSIVFKEKTTEISSTKPVEDFLKMLEQNIPFEEVHSLLERRIEQLISDSFGLQFYPVAIECIEALNKQSLKIKNYKCFNGFMQNLKKFIQERSRNNFWPELKQSGLNLISKSELDESEISEEQLLEFWNLERDTKEEEKKAVPAEDDPENLIDEME